MGLELRHQVKIIEPSEPMVEVDVRLCLTEDGRLVDESDTDARWLYCKPGDRILLSEAKQYGLVPPEPKPEEQEAESEPKAKRPAANKARAKPEDK